MIFGKIFGLKTYCYLKGLQSCGIVKHLDTGSWKFKTTKISDGVLGYKVIIIQIISFYKLYPTEETIYYKIK